MNFIKKLFKKEQKDPNHWSYHYYSKKTKFNNVSDNYFIKESTGQIIRITARDSLELIVYQDLGFNAEEIFDRKRKGNIIDDLGCWDNDITSEDIELWLDEFNKGNMDQAITYVCENRIEGVADDAEGYIALKKGLTNNNQNPEFINDKSDTAFDINKEYLKEHYREMMYVDDVPFPSFPCSAFVPEIDDIMVERIENEGRDSLYGHYRDGYFHEDGEDFIEESFRLLRIYLKKHPEHLGLLNNPEVLDKE